jgi:hypothetical protein
MEGLATERSISRKGGPHDACARVLLAKSRAHAPSPCLELSICRSCGTRVCPVLPVSPTPTLQAFRCARAGGHTPMIPATGIPLALHAPDRRCLTRRSPSGFGSASWFLHRFPFPSLGQPHQIYARVLRRNSPAAVSESPETTAGSAVPKSSTCETARRFGLRKHCERHDLGSDSMPNSGTTR